LRAAAYARYSTDKQTENSIETQLTAIGNYCEQREIDLVANFVDMAMSGTNTERPEFQRMLEAARQKQFEAIVFYDMSRVSRDVADWLGFRKQMQILGIEVISTTETLGDFDDPSSFLTEGITAILAAHMVKQTRQKSMAGVAVKAKKGQFLGGVPPLGYDVIEGEYIVNQPEAEIVRSIFSLYAAGASYDQILDKHKGYRGKRGRPIGKNSIKFILNNERYVGVYSWNKQKVKYMGKWAGGVENSEAVRIEEGMPAIINEETWERVQRRMKNNKHNGANTAKHTYMLSGLVECGKCGGAFTGRTSTSGKGFKTRSYVCGNKYRTKTCDAHNINADELEAAVVIKIKEYFSNSDFSKMADEIFTAYVKGKGSKVEEKKELAKVETQLANGTKAILAGANFSTLNDEMARLNVRKAELEEIIGMTPDLLLTKAMIEDKLKEDAQHLKDGDMARLIKSYVTKIYAHDNEVIITGGVNMSDCGGRI
jgi:site-specific DNA recombinase